MRQYNQIKEEHPQTILLFRVGDFYETFGSDAELVSRELGITLTKRNNGGDQTPLAGFPFHALDSYLPKLVNKGHKVAICEQTEDPESAKKAGRKIVEREVTEITTPGLSLSEKVLNHNRNNYIFSIYKALPIICQRLFICFYCFAKSVEIFQEGKLHLVDFFALLGFNCVPLCTLQEIKVVN